MAGNGTARQPRAITAHGLEHLLAGWRGGGDGDAYRLLAESLRVLVRDGRLPVGARLPAERDLATALTVSRTTVTAAYRQLRDTGHATTRRGAGTYATLPGAHPPGQPPSAEHAIDLVTAALPAPEPWLSWALDKSAQGLAGYARTHGCFPAGLAEFREAVADRYTRRGVPTGPDQILVTGGATGAFALLLRELAGPDDRVAVESPGHPNLVRAVEAAGARPVAVAMRDDGWDLPAWTRAFRATAPRLACLTPDFQQPTGLVMPEEDRRALVGLAASSGATLLVDETPAEPALTPNGQAPLAAFDPAATVISVGSAAKSLWAGLRVGWIRATPQLVRTLAARRAGVDLAPAVLEQLVTRQLLGDPDTFADVVALQRERARAGRDALVAALRRELPGWTFRVPDGGLALWVRTGGRSAPEVATAAERRGVRLAAGRRFGPDAHLEGFLRMPYTQPPELLEEAVRRIARMPHRTERERPA